MIPELGQLALLLALAVALVQGTLPLVGAARGTRRLDGAGAPGGADAVPAGRCSRSRCLTASFVQQRLLGAVRGVRTPIRALPLAYRVAGVWGGHEGSLLLWMLMLSVWMLAVAHVQPHLPLAVVARILAVMGLVSVGFLLFMLLTSNPFDRLLPARGRRARPQPAAAGPGHGDPPADALHGLRRLLGRVRVRRSPR